MRPWPQIHTCILLFCLSAAFSTQILERPRKQNIIFMVSDGMGPAALTLARNFKQYRDELSADEVLEIEKHLVGTLRTYSHSSLVTDSAAAGTALSCGVKTYNGAIAVDPWGKSCGTILEALKLHGYRTGLIATTRITDATPASLSAHAANRTQEDEIAEQQLWEHALGPMVDLLMGGGRCRFLPQTMDGGCRNDLRNLVEEAILRTYSYIEDRDGFDSLEMGKSAVLPLLGLFALRDIPYDIDRDPAVYPSLAEQVETAITTLSEATTNSDAGFFLLIEGSRIDHAGHQNDAAAHVLEVLAYDDAFKVVLNFINSSDTPTIVLSTSDHETGGLAVARQVNAEPDYLWNPEVLLNCKHSGEYLAAKVVAKHQNMGPTFADSIESLRFIAQEIFEHDMGIFDYLDQEVEKVRQSTNSVSAVLEYLNDMVSFRSQTGWTTGGHTAVDVNVYAYSNDQCMTSMLHQYSGLLGNHDNTDIAQFIAKIAGVNLASITDLLERDGRK